MVLGGHDAIQPRLPPTRIVRTSRQDVLEVGALQCQRDALRRVLGGDDTAGDGAS
ncbi:hypothetical protein HMPREF9622_02864 [Cutibacterium modestum HL037PA3]|uniref:Uncharacterized protein n=1 Tax=Cutibacterium modestum HL044PA1 TaxID=765109 RepID=A0ABP2K5D9_9ACTN|nr:hypothetical protein HMPREF9621_02670 [Cutibacterium modestum HL037PA2]EFS92131.1 hypothetical protein HMPREF9607_01760 [Cutibacterium modestum HL044PA1]EFT14097.1 hypothetical protein HMPREF9622_02864 [Cutibacterium modestum HL037PA3]